MTTLSTTSLPDSGVWSWLRERLERQRADLLSQLEDTMDGRPEITATTGQGETEHVVSEVERRVQAVLDAGGLARLADLDDALLRLDLGTYGRCEQCGAAMTIERLEAIPHARHCMTCQIEEEAHRRRRVR